MTRPLDRFLAWQQSWGPQSVAVVPGLLNGGVRYGGLGDPDLLPGQGPTAGGYGEVRAEYESPLFAPEGEEPRTVHMGIDVFASAATPVHAALDGTIHSFANNRGAGNYGPTIVLEHRPTPDLVFHVLYGHLSLPSLEGLVVGSNVAAGQQLGALGDRAVNGDWAPHLHFQVILDIGEQKGDFPGVCTQSSRDLWLARCPDPSRLLGLS